MCEQEDAAALRAAPSIPVKSEVIMDNKLCEVSNPSNVMQEYLRAINKKDKQLHELLELIEKQQCDSFLRETMLSEKLKEAQRKVEHKSETVKSLKKVSEKNALKISQLSHNLDAVQNESRRMAAKAQDEAESGCREINALKSSLAAKEEMISKQQKALEIVHTELMEIAQIPIFAERIRVFGAKKRLSIAPLSFENDVLQEIKEYFYFRQQLEYESGKALCSPSVDGQIPNTKNTVSHDEVLIERLNASCDELKCQLGRKEEEVNACRKELFQQREDLQEKISGLRESVATYEARFQAMEGQNAELRIELQKKEQIFLDFEAKKEREVKTLENRCIEMEERVKMLTREKSDLKVDFESREVEHARRLHSAEASHARDLEEFNRKHRVVQDDLQLHIHRSKEELAAKSQELSLTNQNLSAVKQLLETKTEENRKLQLTIETLQQRASGGHDNEVQQAFETSKMRFELDVQKKESEKIEKKCAEIVEQLQKENKGKEDQLQQLRALLSEKEIALGRAEKQNECFAEEIKCFKWQEQTNAQQKQLAVAEVQRIQQELRNALLRPEAAQEELRLSRDHFEKENHKLQEDLLVWKEKARQLESDLATVERRAEEVKHQTVEKVTELARVQDEARRSLEAARASVPSRSSTPPHSAGDNSRLTTYPHKDGELQSALERILTSEAKLNQVQISAAQREAADMLEKKRLEDELTTCKGSFEMLQETLAERKERIKALKAANHELEEERNLLQSTVEQLKMEVSQKVDEVQEIRNKYKREKAKMDRLVQNYEQRASESSDEERASRSREAILLAELESCEALLQKERQKSQTSTSAIKKPSIASHSLNYAAVTTDVVPVERFDEVCTEVASLRHCIRRAERILDQVFEQIADNYIDIACETKKMLVEVLFPSGSRDNLLLMAERVSRSTLDSLLDENKLTKGRVAVLEKQLLVAESAGDAVQESKFHALEKNREIQLAEASQRAKEDIQKVRKELLDRLEVASMENEKLLSQLQESEAKLKSMSAGYARLQEEYKLQREKTEATYQQLVEAEGRCTTIRRDADEVNRNAISEIHDLRCKLEESMQKCGLSDALIRELQSEIELHQKAGLAKAEEIQHLNQQQRSLMGKLGEAIIERDGARADSSQLQHQVELLSAQLVGERDTSQLHAVKMVEIQTRAEAQISSMESQISLLNSDKQKLEKLLRQSQMKEESIRGELITAHASLEGLEEKIEIKNSEISLLRERCANCESLKLVAESSLEVSQEREKHLRDQLEEFRRSNHIFQACVDKQQEQYRLSRDSKGEREKTA